MHVVSSETHRNIQRIEEIVRKKCKKLEESLHGPISMRTQNIVVVFESRPASGRNRHSKTKNFASGDFQKIEKNQYFAWNCVALA